VKARIRIPIIKESRDDLKCYCKVPSEVSCYLLYSAISHNVPGTKSRNLPLMALNIRIKGTFFRDVTTCSLVTDSCGIDDEDEEFRSRQEKKASSLLRSIQTVSGAL